MTTRSPDLTVVCHVRTSLFLEPVDAKIETLTRCEREDVIDSLILRSWPEQIRLDEESPYQESIDVYERYVRWAENAGCSVQPPFTVRTASSLAVEDEWEVLVTPVLCLGLYSDETLIGVFPHTDGEVTHAATDAIAALRTGELPPPIDEAAQGASEAVAFDESETEAPESACPHCGQHVVNVHGLLACTNCRWTASTDTQDQPRLRQH